MKCIVCGKEFTPTRSTQRYCSNTCRRYANHHGIHPARTEISCQGPVIREFTCLQCGKRVRVTDSRDCRTKFCSQHCAKLYWKHSKKVSSVVVPRTFACRECGKVVIVTTPKDRRRIFCCDDCRKRWFSRKEHRSHKTVGTLYENKMRRMQL